MSNFGELCLILGDLHIPQRSSKIPAAFKRMLVPNKMQHVICTGNLSAADYDELRDLAPNVHVVAGDYDNDGSLVFPETRVIQVGAFRIGVIHGHQILPWNSHDALARMRRKLNVDILVSGHTHKNEVTVHEGSYYFINPGSITGAYSSLSGTATPSFVLLAVQDTKITCYVYELGENGEVDVSKTEFTKTAVENPASVSTTNPALLESLLK
jgi:vacuolar protein sorting-associated protein 29